MINPTNHMMTVKRNATDALTIQMLAARYRSRETTPTAVVEECLSRIETHADPATWITLFDREAVMVQARAAEERIKAGETLPLLGVPFAVKDNIDIAGCSTKSRQLWSRNCCAPAPLPSGKPISINSRRDWLESDRPMARREARLTPILFRAGQVQGRPPQ
jgi:hypothetical protein